MAGNVQETEKSIQPYGGGDYFNGCKTRRVTTIVELPEDLTERFIDVLGARDASGQVDSMILNERITPIGRAVGAALRDRLAETQPVCRKGNMTNCGVNVSEFSEIVFQTEEGTLEPHIPAHVACDTALINKVPSNKATAAPVSVENAAPYLQFDMGCMAQMTAAGELAGQLMLEQLLKLETAKAATLQA